MKNFLIFFDYLQRSTHFYGSRLRLKKKKSRKMVKESFNSDRVLVSRWLQNAGLNGVVL